MNPITDKNGSYRTGTVSVSLLARALPSLVYYPKMIAIVFRASSIAKRGRYDNDSWFTSSLDTVRGLESVGVRINITGMNNVRSLDGPCVFVANHMSTLETFALPSIILPFKDLTFVVKKSLVEYPVFKHVMRAVKPIVVERTNPREDLKAVLEQGSRHLLEGRSVLIFPQTTRSYVFTPEKFNSIGIKLAMRAKVPVIPVALRTDAWGNGTIFKDFGKIDPSLTVHFAFGVPLTVTDRGSEEHKKVIEFIDTKLREWRG